MFIRFYNSGTCALGISGFSQSLKHWYEDIVPSAHLPFPRVFLGALSLNNNNTGYVSVEDFPGCGPGRQTAGLLVLVE